MCLGPADCDGSSDAAVTHLGERLIASTAMTGPSPVFVGGVISVELFKVLLQFQVDFVVGLLGE